MLENKQYFLFDMDGLLIDSERLHLHFWGEIFKQNHIENGLEIMKQLIGTSGTKGRELLIELTGDPDFFKPYQAQKDKAFYGYLETNGMPVKKYARELLDYLVSHDYDIYLVSSTHADRLEKFLKYAKLDVYFKHIISGDMAPHSKPSPDLYQLCCEKYGLDKSKCIAFEDSPNGILASHLAGIDVIGIPDINDISHLQYDHLIDIKESLEDIFNLLVEES